MCVDHVFGLHGSTRVVYETEYSGIDSAKLIEFPSIKFSGEFADLREFLANAKKDAVMMYYYYYYYYYYYL